MNYPQPSHDEETPAEDVTHETQHSETETSSNIENLTAFIHQFIEETLSKPSVQESLDDLTKVGEALYKQFKASGELEQINLTIDCWSAAVSLAPGAHEDRPKILNNLGNAYLKRFENSSQSLLDLGKAIECGREAVSLTLDGDPSKPGALNNLGNSYLARFECLGQLQDIEDAVRCGSEAASLVPNNHPTIPTILSNLGGSHLARFKQLGEMLDLNRSIGYGLEALDLIPEGCQLSPGILSNLGWSYLARFERLGDLEDLNNSIKSGTEALSLTPIDHPDRSVRLSNLGSLYLARFEHLGEPQDLDRAIEDGSEAVLLMADGHSNAPGVFNKLGGSYQARFKRDGNLTDLDEAIKWGLKALSLTPDGHPEKPGRLNNLGNSYLTLFQRLGKVCDVDISIKYMAEAVSLTPDNHVGKPVMLNNLANSYLTRFERTDELLDLDKAVECGAKSVLLTPDSDPMMPNRLSSLGISYLARFNRLGELLDVNQAIEYGSKAISISPDNHPIKSVTLNNLGSSYLTRFERLGELLDLEKSIEHKNEALSLNPSGHINNPAILSNLGASYLTRFKRLGDGLDLDRAVECMVEVAALVPDDHPDKHGALGNLEQSYLSRFRYLGMLPDLNRAIECGLAAISLIPDGHPGKPEILTNLGDSYRVRFALLGELLDLNKAIECGSNAASLTSDTHLGKPGALSSLGLSYLARFERIGELIDLNEAITCGEMAVSLTPDEHPNKPGRLNNLGISYSTRFGHLREIQDLDKSIECGLNAVLLTPDNHISRPGNLSNLGSSYLTRFERLGELADLNRAIKCASEANTLTPNHHPNKSGILDILGCTHSAQFRHSPEPSNIESAIACFEGAAQSLAGPPIVKFRSCRRWAQLASRNPLFSPYQAYLKSMDLLPQLVWIGTTIERRYNLIAEIGDFATEAAAYAISTGRHELAVEWLEAGRSIVWGQIAQLRTPFDELSTRNPDLANQLKRVGIMLERVGARSASASSLESDAHDATEDTGRHTNLALDWNKYLNEARAIPGFEDFLRPPTVAKLLSAARSHPIAIINVHRLRSDALILQPECKDITHVPLPDFPIESLASSRGSLAVLGRDRKPGRLNNSHSLERSLGKLWFGVVKPVLDSLNYTVKHPTVPPPRITWCATGILSFLPLHAAGCYDDSRSNTFHFVISSYTPTLSVLLATPPAHPNSFHGLLAVGQESTPGLNRLPGTKDELKSIQLHVPTDSFLQLEDEEATVNKVLDAMDKLSWVHMACHGSQQTTDPTKSAFHLHDGDLTLATITKRSFQNKGLAFLSACQTATGDRSIADEAIHLAAGMLMAGYPSVIGTMWSIEDEDGPVVADKVYAELLKEGKLDHTKSASALHQAVAHLRSGIQPHFGSIDRPLEEVWLGLAKPILDFLGFGYTRKLPIAELPRLTWCTTGLLSFLPLHAVGCDGEFQSNVFDFVISSYTPTLSTLLTERTPDPGSQRGMVAVGQEHTPGFDHLPGTKDELTAIQSHAPTSSYLQLENTEATIDRVLNAMDEFSWVHMACHGSQDTTDPTQSAFHLSDGGLTLATITKRSFQGKGLAFLSACQTATGDQNMAEEAVHLAAGMLMAGYPSVIGTMWSIEDEDGPLVADRVYAELLKDGTMDHTKSARALHQAISHLREKVGEKAISRWAPFIHIGA